MAYGLPRKLAEVLVHACGVLGISLSDVKLLMRQPDGPSSVGVALMKVPGLEQRPRAEALVRNLRIAVWREWAWVNVMTPGMMCAAAVGIGCLIGSSGSRGSRSDSTHHSQAEGGLAAVARKAAESASRAAEAAVKCAAAAADITKAAEAAVQAASGRHDTAAGALSRVTIAYMAVNCVKHLADKCFTSKPAKADGDRSNGGD